MTRTDSQTIQFDGYEAESLTVRKRRRAPRPVVIDSTVDSGQQLTDWLSDREHAYDGPLLGKLYPLASTINFPRRSGVKFQGTADGRVLHEKMHEGDERGGETTRIAAVGKLAQGGTMVNVPDKCWRPKMGEMQLMGAMVEDAYGAKFPKEHAKIGIHYNAINNDGPSFLTLDDTTFFALDTCIQVGPVEGPGTAKQGDTIRAGNVTAQQFNTFMEVNADNACVQRIGYLHVRSTEGSTSKNRVAYRYREGGEHHSYTYINGNLTLLELHKHSSHYGDFNLGFQTDGTSDDICLVDMMSAGSACTRVFLKGRMADAPYKGQIIKGNGSAYISVCVENLKPGCLSFIGDMLRQKTAPHFQRHCWIDILPGSSFNGCKHPADLIADCRGPAGSCHYIVREGCRHIAAIEGDVIHHGSAVEPYSGTNSEANKW
jgi:hypothetical protein